MEALRREGFVPPLKEEPFVSFSLTILLRFEIAFLVRKLPLLASLTYLLSAKTLGLFRAPVIVAIRLILKLSGLILSVVRGHLLVLRLTCSYDVFSGKHVLMW